MPRILMTIARCAAVLSIIGAGLATPGAQAAELTFALRIENGHVPANMRLIRVQQGDVVKLQCSADRRAIVHLHGYDIEKDVAPGTVTELMFTANLTGRFQVHLHPGKGGSGEPAHEETLVNIEVYPR
jgi:hypothetical protein